METKRAAAYERLARLMADRADELDLDWVQVAEAAEVTVETVRAVRRGKNEPSRGTKRGLERALRWSSGSIDRILDGGEPTPLFRRSSEEPRDDFDERIARIRANPAARARLLDLLVAARLPEAEEEDDQQRQSDAG